MRRKGKYYVSIVCLVLVAAAFLWTPAQAHGGGVPQLTGQVAGPYRLYAWSQPDPIRAGETHLTVGVTLPKDSARAADAASQDEVPVTDADVLVSYHPLGGGAPVIVRAVAQSSLSSVYYESDAEIPAPGLWRVEIDVAGSEGRGSAAFEAEVAAARRLNGPLVAAAGAVSVLTLLLLALRARRGEATKTKGDETGPARRARAGTSDVTQQTNVQSAEICQG